MRKRSPTRAKSKSKRSPRSTDERDKLITEYQRYVHGIVGQLIRSLGLPADHSDEYVSAGYLGLVEAAERFNSASGAEFKTFAFLRIRGAIIDAIRETTYLSSKAYRFAKALQATHELREAEITGGEARAADVKPDLARVLDGVAKGALVFRLSGESSESVLAAVATPDANADQIISENQEISAIREWVATLPEKERLIIEEYYFNEKSFVDIANTYDGLSKSWISRLHARALEMLKSRMLFQGLEPLPCEARGIRTPC